MSPEVSVVIPLYRSGKWLTELCERLTHTFKAHRITHEIVLVDDSSPDDTWDHVERLKCDTLRAVRHSRNFGQHKALLTGLRLSRGKYVVTMDDDLQHRPEDIPALLAPLRNDTRLDAVVAKFDLKSHPWYRRLGSQLVNRLNIKIAQIRKPMELTSFRILTRDTVDAILEIRTGFPRITHLLLRVTDRIENVQVGHDARPYGRSGYTLPRLVSNALDTIVGNSSYPLQLMSMMGFVFSILGFTLLVLFLAKYLITGIQVKGWMTITFLILFFSGLILFCFGIVGEYLSRIIGEINTVTRSPIRESRNLSPAEQAT